MGKLLIVFAVIFLATFSSAEKDRFDNYKVFVVEVDNEAQLQVLQEMEKAAFSSYDFWKNPTYVGRSAEVMVPPHKMSEFNDIMETLQFRSSLKISNVQELVDKEQPKVTPVNDGFNWERYQTMDEINAWMDQIEAEYSDVLTPLSYGYSYEMERIRGVLLSYRSGNPAVFIESHIHAREWIAGASTTYILNEFLTSTDPDVRRIAESYDWYIFPVTNPDGYRHSHNVNRMWRKTRSRHGVICVGVDPNRNFGYQWQDGSGPGASGNVCSEIFAGPAAFSELETGQLANFVLQRLDHIKVYLSMHSFSQLLLYPYAHTSTPSQNAQDLNQIGRVAADRLRESFGTEYAVHSMNDLYIATGTSADWSYGGAGITLSYTYEFRDNGTHGFLLPPDQIIPNSIEVLQSLIGLMDEADRLGYF